jgi:hypothetical protein
VRYEIGDPAHVIITSPLRDLKGVPVRSECHAPGANWRCSVQRKDARR